MNYLQMVQFVQGNIGTSVDLPFAGPSTIVGATGQYLELVRYVQQAYKSIQIEQQDWKFRTKKGMFNLVSGQNIYSLEQIQQQIGDWEDIVHMHFIDDSQYSLTAIHQTAPVNTVTSGAVTVNNAGAIAVPVTNISTYQPFQQVYVNGGANTIIGIVQSISGSVVYFDFYNNTQTTGTPTAIAPGSAVSYVGAFPPENIGSQQFCFFIEYQNWRGWKDRSVLPAGRPVYYTRDPSGAIEFNPVPDTANSPYVFLTDYRMSVDEMNQINAAAPATMPARYHEAICWKAIMYWAISRKQGDRYTASKAEYDRIMNKMYTEQLPSEQVYLMELYG